MGIFSILLRHCLVSWHPPPRLITKNQVDVTRVPSSFSQSPTKRPHVLHIMKYMALEVGVYIVCGIIYLHTSNQKHYENVFLNSNGKTQ